MKQTTFEFKKTEVICSHCGAKNVAYKHGFNKGLVAVLRKISASDQPRHLADLGLTTSQYSNAAKLQYWGLIKGELDRRKGSKWIISRLGRDFMDGIASIPKYAIVRRNAVERFEGPDIFFYEIDDGYKLRPEYQAEAHKQIGG